MIDPKELRIGNLLKWEDKYIRVDSLVNNDGWHLSDGVNGHYVKLDDIDPIPLTEEILWNKNILHPLMELDHDFKLMGVDYGIRARYLHQLQNLYFCLTSKELEIEL